MVDFAEYIKKECPEVEKPPKVPDFMAYFPSFSWCNCSYRKVWLNGVLSRAFMFSVKTWRKLKGVRNA